MWHAVVHYSGGLSSHLAAKRIVEEMGSENVTLLFCDTKSEDPDLYCFVREGSAALGAQLVTLTEGRTIWEVMADERYLANTRVDPCSRTLKRRPAAKWMREHFTLMNAFQVFGYSQCERNRLERTAKGIEPWHCRAPLCEAPTLRAGEVQKEFALECPDLRPPRLYALGAPHNNCGGLCVKAGQKHFAWALKAIPEKYAEWEREEQKLCAHLGDVAILRDRRGGTTRPMTLAEFRVRTNVGVLPQFEKDTSCECFMPQDGDDDPQD